MKEIVATKTKYKTRLKTFGANIKQMEIELTKDKSSLPNKASKNQLNDLNRKDINDSKPEQTQTAL